MIAPPICPNESRRQAALAELDIFGTPPEAAFDRITHELATIFNVPLATIAFIDAANQHYKARVLPDTLAEQAPPMVPRNISICGHVVGSNQSLIIEDLAAHPGFADHPIVTQFGLRFYSGTPLRSDDGQAVGSLCIMDAKPRRLTETESGLLKMIADAVMTEVKLRRDSVRLAQRNEQIERDLTRARAMQRFLLPPETLVAGPATISQLYVPHDHLGGDFLDVLVRPDGSAAVLIADVTGHGASAALLAAMTKTTFGRHAPNTNNPAELLNAIHADLFSASPSGQFMTAIAGVLDPQRARLTLASAGHPQPILVGPRGAAPLDIAGDIPLLIEPDVRYSSTTTIDLTSHDRLLVYTDGAVEATNDAQRPLEPAGLADLARMHLAVRGTRWLRAIHTDITTYAQQRMHDDVALLSIECGLSQENSN